MGRPATCTCGKCEKCRARARKREWYRKQPKERRQKLVANRSKEAQRKAEKKRSAKPNPARKAMHKRLVANEDPVKKKARANRPDPKGHKCAVCGSSTNVEFHHTSYKPPKGEWRCARHNPRGGAVKKKS